MRLKSYYEQTIFALTPNHQKKRCFVMDKLTLRRKIKTILNAKSRTSIIEDSKEIQNRIKQLSCVLNARTIFAYLPIKNEVDLGLLLGEWISDSRIVCVPIVNWTEQTMKPGLLTEINDTSIELTQHGVHEPVIKKLVPRDAIDLILVPGLAFDRGGRRLGRGGGFYDRFLQLVKPKLVFGVAFDEQVVDSVPVEGHDAIMTSVITPTRTIF